MSINEHLKSQYNIMLFDELSSTNDTAKELGIKGYGENTVIIAKSQTSGRGRMGRKFYSPNASGIYMSVLLKPNFPPTDTTLITVAAASATALALDSVCGIDSKIKWVNDIYFKNKKICGILTESTFLNSEQYFSVVGIGVNLYTPESDFPDDIKNIAGAVYETPCSEEIREKLIAEILNNFSAYYKNLTDKEFLTVYRKKSNLIGKTVKYLYNGNETEAEVQYINDNAHLIVKKASGETAELFAGEVSVKLF